MGTVSAAELLYAALRLVFAGLLLAVAAAALLMARRTWLTPGGTGRGPGGGAPPARLTLIEAAPEDGPPGKTVLLASGLILGRRSECGLVLRDTALSAQHARFDAHNGRWVLSDLGSTNGTYVNGVRLSGPAKLQPGDIVTTGAAAWRFDTLG